ncbi:Atg14 domain-containing protein [Arthrobacter sp. Z1-9]
MEDEALAEIANELYAKPMEDFVAARSAAAKEASRSDKELGAAVKALPKPSVAAWAVNMLALHQPDVLAELADLGGRMRGAQSSLDAAALRELGRERRTMLAAAVDTARSVAQQQGRSISDAMATDVEETLRALTADEGAAAAVQSGRLVKTLSADGVNAVELEGSVAVPAALPAPRAAPAPAKLPPRKEQAREEQTQSTTAAGATRSKPDKPRLEAVRQTPRPTSPPALEKAKAALAEAQAAEAETAQLARDLQDQADETRTEIAELQQETAELRARLKAAEDRLEQCRKKLVSTTAEAKQAVRAADKAERTAMLAQERVLRLGNTRG